MTLVAKALEGMYDGAIHITTDYEVGSQSDLLFSPFFQRNAQPAFSLMVTWFLCPQILTIPVKALIAVGTLNSSPKHIVLPPSFPVSNIMICSWVKISHLPCTGNKQKMRSSVICRTNLPVECLRCYGSWHVCICVFFFRGKLFIKASAYRALLRRKWGYSRSARWQKIYVSIINGSATTKTSWSRDVNLR